MGPSLESIASDMREALKKLEEWSRAYTKNIKWLPSEDFWDKSECIAQSILAMRHIEDARMRYGKVIQYLNDWVSIYDKK